MKIQSTRSVSMDFVRIFAAFWVLGFHWFTCPGCFYGFKSVPEMDWMPAIFQTVFQWGFLGVDVFFILSGSLIARSALNNEWSLFAKARFVRLFPAYLTVGLLSLFLYPIATNTQITVEKIFSLSGLQFWIGGPAIIFTGWTLPIEISFYLLVTLALFFFSTKKNFGIKEMRSFLNAWCLLYVMGIALNFEPMQKFLIPSYAPYFILGAILSSVKSKSDFISNIFVITVSTILTLKFVFFRVDAYPMLNNKFITSILLVLFMCGIIIYSNTRELKTKTNRFTQMTQTLSRMTYPVYLVHLEVGLTFVYVFHRAGLQAGYPFLAAFVAVLVISYLIVKIIEPFFRRLMLQNFHTKS